MPKSIRVNPNYIEVVNDKYTVMFYIVYLPEERYYIAPVTVTDGSKSAHCSIPIVFRHYHSGSELRRGNDFLNALLNGEMDIDRAIEIIEAINTLNDAFKKKSTMFFKLYSKVFDDPRGVAERAKRHMFANRVTTNRVVEMIEDAISRGDIEVLEDDRTLVLKRGHIICYAFSSFGYSRRRRIEGMCGYVPVIDEHNAKMYVYEGVGALMFMYNFARGKVKLKSKTAKPSQMSGELRDLKWVADKLGECGYATKYLIEKLSAVVAINAVSDAE